MTTHAQSKNPGGKPPATEAPDIRERGGLIDGILYADLNNPRRNVLDPEALWAVWYPLREHGTIGRATDKNDNDFVIGLIGKRLNPLSKLVERMRKTTQTSLYMETMGPFFTGKVLWQSERPQ